MAKPLLRAQPMEAAVKMTMAIASSRRIENMRIRSPVSGIVTISAIR